MWEMVVLAGLTGGAAPVPAVGATTPPLVSPKRLIEMFLQNEAFADRRYVNKVIHVRGKVARVMQDANRRGYDLRLDPEGAGRDPDERLDLILRFPAKESAALAALNRGDGVTVKGLCQPRDCWRGDVLKGEREYSQVFLTDCTLLPKDKPAPATPAPKEP